MHCQQNQCFPELCVFQILRYSIGVTETWLSDKICDNELLPAYTIICKDCGSRGGGVMLAIKSSLSYEVLSTPPSVEVLTVSVGSSNPTVYC